MMLVSLNLEEGPTGLRTRRLGDRALASSCWYLGEKHHGAVSASGGDCDWMQLLLQEGTAVTRD